MDATSAEPVVTSAMRRTRGAILNAAIEMLPSDSSVSLGDIAERAGVGRSTLHRHFTDRADLIRALSLHVRDLSNAALEDADSASGEPIAALRRVVEGQFDLGPILSVLHAEPGVRSDRELVSQFSVGEETLVAALKRAADPADPTSLEWRIRVFWELVRLGARFTDTGVARHVAVDAIMHTLTNGIAASR